MKLGASRLLLLLSGVGGAITVAYIILKLSRLSGIGGAHIGADVVIMAYIVPAAGLSIALVLGRAAAAAARPWKFLVIAVLLINALALASWTYVHQTGRIISKEAMLEHRR